MLNKIRIAVVVGVTFALLLSTHAFAQGQQRPVDVTITLHTGTKVKITSEASAHRWWNTTNGYVRDQNAKMDRLNNDLKIIKYGIQDKKTELEDAVINGLGALYDGSNGSALASIILGLRKKKQLWDIEAKQIEKYVEIASHKPTVKAYADDRDTVYGKYMEWWHYVNPSGSGGTPPAKGPEPQQPDVPDPLSLPCKNNCGMTFSSASYSMSTLASTAETSHQVTCTHAHGYTTGEWIRITNTHNISQVSLPTPAPYWNCPNISSECPKKKWHMASCRGGCGTMFTVSGKSGWWNRADMSHITWCSEKLKFDPVHFAAHLSMTCRGYYFNCKEQTSDDCINARKHINGDSEEETSNPSPPSYHACGVHETTVAGSHASASCGESGHYACDSKTHTAAVCGTTGHYNCDNKNHSMQVSCTIHSPCEVINFYACDNHDPAVTCANGHSYNPTIAGENNMHRTRTCEWCAQTWEKCVSLAPICNKPYRKRNGLSCRAID